MFLAAAVCLTEKYSVTQWQEGTKMSLTYKKVGYINNQYNLKALLAVHEALQLITSNSFNSSCLPRNIVMLYWDLFSEVEVLICGKKGDF